MSDFERVKSDVFVTIANSFLKDKNLSNKAKGVLAMILSLPDSWDFSIKGMVKITKDGEASLRAAINEMKENGYCAMKQVRVDNKIARWKYLFSGEKLTESLLCDFLQVENLNEENRAQYNINKENKKENNNSLTHTACADRNYLQEEYYKLMDDLSWKEVICMNYHLTMDELRKTLIHFFLDCKCAGTTQHQNEQDVKSHFNSWLKKKNNGNNSTNIRKQQKRGKTLDEFIEDSIAELHRSKPEV
jgi:hypothetical protein